MTARLEDKGDRIIVWNGNVAKRGALSPELYDAISTAVVQARDPRIKSIIITSEGSFFCSGGDLNVLRERRKLTEEQRREKVDALHDLSRAIRGSTVPVIAAIEGGAAGAGLSLAFACDLIVASRGAQFTAAYVKAGLVPDGGLTSALARMLPRPMAMEMCLLARPVSAEQLMQFGAVNRVVDPGQAFAEAMAVADVLSKGPKEAQGVIRRLVSQAYEENENAQLDAERDAMARAAGGAEAAEGIAAFLEKRKPSY